MLQLDKNLLLEPEVGDEIIGLFWNKKSGRFLGVLFTENENVTIRRYSNWDPLDTHLGNVNKAIELKNCVDFKQTEHIELIHTFGNSICNIIINGKCVRIC